MKCTILQKDKGLSLLSLGYEIFVLRPLNCLQRKREDLAQAEGTAAEKTKKVQRENDKGGG